MNLYLKEYKWSNVFTMIRNLSFPPRVCQQDFDHHLVVITGATSGIGLATAQKYASHKSDLVLVNRNEQKSKALCEELEEQYGVKCSYILADFTKLADVHAAAEKLNALDRNIDVLIHNAGIFNTTRMLSADHLETVFQTNYLSTFILNYSLREKFRKQAGGRILFVNSEAYRFAAFGLHLDDLSWNRHHYSGINSYGSAKLAQLLSMLKFADYFSGSGVTINAMHPGNVRTNSGQNNGKIYKSYKKLLLDRNSQPMEYATEALYYLGVSDEVAASSGKFFNLTTEEETAPPAQDRAAAEKLWAISLELGGFHG